MSSRHVVVAGLDEWIDGFDDLARGVGPGMEREWRYATERFYDHTQRFTHVISGDMRASGRYAVDKMGREVHGTVTYGGTPDCDYAIYEIARGGSHDNLQQGFVANIDTFEQAIVDGIAADIESWR